MAAPIRARPRRPLRRQLICSGSAAAAALLATGLAACGGGGRPAASTPRIPDPGRTVAANPDYTRVCTPSGLDSSLPCIQVTLKAIDNARAREGVGPMALPADFPRLAPPEQLFVALDRERVDRGLAPFIGLSDALDQLARKGADAAALPPDPGNAYRRADTEWLGGAANGLDADYQWLYDDGPGSGACSSHGRSGCWADRHLVLEDLGPTGTPVVGAAVNPTADTTSGDRGGPSLAAILAVAVDPPAPLAYRWAQAVADTGAGTIRPETAGPANTSATHIPDPPRTVPPTPDFTPSCATEGLDSSAGCLRAVREAIDAARAAEGVRPMVLPADFGQLTVPEQLLVAVDLERVDRGLPAFVGLTGSLDRNAQRGADIANDPPAPKGSFAVADTEWAGGSANGLDAVYGWMYDDGPGSGNLDCPRTGGPGCWGHRHGILDDFGSVGTQLMGAAVNPTGDTTAGDKGGTSMALTLVVTTDPPGPLAFSWDQVGVVAGAGVPPAGPGPGGS